MKLLPKYSPYLISIYPFTWQNHLFLHRIVLKINSEVLIFCFANIMTCKVSTQYFIYPNKLKMEIKFIRGCFAKPTFNNHYFHLTLCFLSRSKELTILVLVQTMFFTSTTLLGRWGRWEEQHSKNSFKVEWLFIEVFQSHEYF